LICLAITGFLSAPCVCPAGLLRPTKRAAHYRSTQTRSSGTAAAARFLARQYRGDVYPLDHEALLGLLSSPSKQAGADEMGRMLRDPDFLVTAPFLDALAVLNTPSADATWPAIRARLPFLRRQLSEALPTKRGQALATSKQTYMAGLEQLAAVKFGSDQITQIIQMVEQLSPIDQDLWLGQRWTQVSDQRWLPVLQKTRSARREFPAARQSGTCSDRRDIQAGSQTLVRT